MAFLIGEINIDQKPNFYYHKNHLNSFYLMSAFYYKSCGELLNEKKYINLFSLENCVYSYSDLITILYQIYLFGDVKIESKKSKIKKVYTTLSKDLKYAHFSEDFLVNYFAQC